MSLRSTLPFTLLLLALAMPAYAQQQIAVAGDLTRLHEGVPGDTIRGTLAIVNATDQTQEARLLVRDLLYLPDGSMDTPSPGTLPRSSAGWLTLNQDLVQLPPKQTVEVGYSIALPASSEANALGGSYWCAVLIEPIARGTAESSLQEEGQPQPGIQIPYKIRYLVQIVSTIEGTGQKTLTIASTEIRRADDGVYLDVLYEHTGTRAFRPTVWLELYDATGLQVGQFEGKNLLVYPGTSKKNSIALHDVPAGTYTGLLVLDGGENALFGAQLELKL